MLSLVVLNVVMLNVVAPKICFHCPMQCFQNALPYFVTVVSYTRKMLIKLIPDLVAQAAIALGGLGLLATVAYIPFYIGNSPFRTY